MQSFDIIALFTMASVVCTHNLDPHADDQEIFLESAKAFFEISQVNVITAMTFAVLKIGAVLHILFYVIYGRTIIIEEGTADF